MRKRLLVGVLAVATSLIFAGTSLASYWFFQGYLPRPDGTRSVFLGYAPPTPRYVRSSWSPCTHDMKAVFIRTDYSWEGHTFLYINGCDHHIMDQFPNAHVNYGCQNPEADPQVYDNCYAGTNW
jgi:hypothetical protein